MRLCTLGNATHILIRTPNIGMEGMSSLVPRLLPMSKKGRSLGVKLGHANVREQPMNRTVEPFHWTPLS